MEMRWIQRLLSCSLVHGLAGLFIQYGIQYGTHSLAAAAAGAEGGLVLHMDLCALAAADFRNFRTIQMMSMRQKRYIRRSAVNACYHAWSGDSRMFVVVDVARRFIVFACGWVENNGCPCCLPTCPSC